MNETNFDYDYPLDHIKVDGLYKEFDPHDPIIDQLNELYMKNHNCTVNGLIYDSGLFYIFLDGDISWTEKVKQVELFNLKYLLLGNKEDDFLIINDKGQIVEPELCETIRNWFKWSPVTPLTKKLIWDFVNKHLSDYNRIYRVSNIFMNKQEGNCKVVLKNLTQDNE